MREILHAHAEETAKHTYTYLEFLDKLLQEKNIAIAYGFLGNEGAYEN